MTLIWVSVAFNTLTLGQVIRILVYGYRLASPEAASELDHALRLEWDIVEGRFVGNLLRSECISTSVIRKHFVHFRLGQAAIAENLKALDVPTLGKGMTLPQF